MAFSSALILSTRSRSPIRRSASSSPAAFSSSCMSWAILASSIVTRRSSWAVSVTSESGAGMSRARDLSTGDFEKFALDFARFRADCRKVVWGSLGASPRGAVEKSPGGLSPVAATAPVAVRASALGFGPPSGGGRGAGDSSSHFFVHFSLGCGPSQIWQMCKNGQGLILQSSSLLNA